MKSYRAILVRGEQQEIVKVVPCYYAGEYPVPIIHYGELVFYLNKQIAKDLYLYADYELTS